MKLIDTHTHVYLPEFEQDRESMMKQAAKAGVSSLLLPNIDVESINQMLAFHSAFPGQVRLMWGLHPCSVGELWEQDLQQICSVAQQADFAAVGEIGLDFYWSLEFKSAQVAALEFQLKWAYETQKPVSLHTRQATAETISAVKPWASKGLCGVFHCFSGTEEEAREIVDMGFYLGIGGAVTYKNNALKAFLGNIPLEALVLETDAPYLSPVPHRGKRNEPAYLLEVVYFLADLYKLPPAEIAEITTENAKRVFSLEF